MRSAGITIMSWTIARDTCICSAYETIGDDSASTSVSLVPSRSTRRWIPTCAPSATRRSGAPINTNTHALTHEAPCATEIAAASRRRIRPISMAAKTCPPWLSTSTRMRTFRPSVRWASSRRRSASCTRRSRKGSISPRSRTVSRHAPGLGSLARGPGSHDSVHQRDVRAGRARSTAGAAAPHGTASINMDHNDVATNGIRRMAARRLTARGPSTEAESSQTIAALRLRAPAPPSR